MFTSRCLSSSTTGDWIVGLGRNWDRICQYALRCGETRSQRLRFSIRENLAYALLVEVSKCLILEDFAYALLVEVNKCFFSSLNSNNRQCLGYEHEYFGAYGTELLSRFNEIEE